jgi:hypothetical protein
VFAIRASGAHSFITLCFIDELIFAAMQDKLRAMR